MKNDDVKRFSQYAKCTTGKRKIADCLADVFLDLDERSVLDVGAGSGEVAMHLAPLANRLVCLEPNELLFKQLKNVMGSDAECFHSDIESWTGADQFDVALLSYVLDSYVGSERFGRVIEACRARLKASGKLVAVTYLEGSNWDLFADIVSSDISVKRTGGYARVVPQLRAGGYRHKILAQIPSVMYGRDIDDLYGNLEFFFKESSAKYKEKKALILRCLERFVSIRDQYCCIDLIEVVLQIDVRVASLGA